MGSCYEKGVSPKWETNKPLKLREFDGISNFQIFLDIHLCFPRFLRIWICFGDSSIKSGKSSFAGSHDIDITTVLDFVLSDILLGYGLWQHCSKYWYANCYEVAMYVYIILYELLWPYLSSYTWFSSIHLLVALNIKVIPKPFRKVHPRSKRMMYRWSTSVAKDNIWIYMAYKKLYPPGN